MMAWPNTSGRESKASSVQSHRRSSPVCARS